MTLIISGILLIVCALISLWVIFRWVLPSRTFQGSEGRLPVNDLRSYPTDARDDFIHVQNLVGMWLTILCLLVVTVAVILIIVGVCKVC
jgi:hypothetical protein